MLECVSSSPFLFICELDTNPCDQCSSCLIGYPLNLLCPSTFLALFIRTQLCLYVFYLFGQSGYPHTVSTYITQERGRG